MSRAFGEGFLRSKKDGVADSNIKSIQRIGQNVSTSQYINISPVVAKNSIIITRYAGWSGVEYFNRLFGTIKFDIASDGVTSNRVYIEKPSNQSQNSTYFDVTIIEYKRVKSKQEVEITLSNGSTVNNASISSVDVSKCITSLSYRCSVADTTELLSQNPLYQIPYLTLASAQVSIGTLDFNTTLKKVVARAEVLEFY